MTDVMPEVQPAFGLSEIFKGPSLGAKRELQRLQIAQTWGVWLWVIAELVPNGDSRKLLSRKTYYGCESGLKALRPCHLMFTVSSPSIQSGAIVLIDLVFHIPN